MLRITILFLMGLVMQSAHGEEVFYVDVLGLKQVAVDAALYENPELLPGDLTDDRGGLIHITCWTEDVDKCRAHIQFGILSTTKDVVVREGETCSRTVELQSVHVTVLPNGSVLSVNSNGSGASTISIDCPADIDDKELTGL